MFFNDEDYQVFEQVIEEALECYPMRLLSYCVTPDRWNMVLWPKSDGDLAKFMQRITVTHVRRWKTRHKMKGTGLVYKGRFKSFPIAREKALHQVIRYVERSPVRAGLVTRAEQWPWSSLWIREFGDQDYNDLLSTWPVAHSGKWLTFVNKRESKSDLESLTKSSFSGTPYGSDAWIKRTAKKLGLQSSLRKQGRPRKK